MSSRTIKIKRIIYICLTVAFIAVTVFFACSNKKKDKYIYKGFGYDKTEDIRLNNKNDLKIIFDVEKNLDGISIKYKTSKIVSENAKLVYDLYDYKTGKLLYSNEISIYCNSGNVPAYLKITGLKDYEGRVICSLYTKRCEDVTLVFDGCKESKGKEEVLLNDDKKDYYVDFSTVYCEKEVDVDVFLNYILIIFVFICLLYIVKTSSSISVDEIRYFKKDNCNKKKIIHYFFVMLLFFVLSFFMYNVALKKTIEIKQTTPEDVSEELELGEGNYRIVQSFKNKNDDLTGIVFKIIGLNDNKIDEINVIIKNLNSGIIYYDKNIKTKNVSDGRIVCYFDEIQRNVKNNDILVELDFQIKKGDIKLGYSKKTSEGFYNSVINNSEMIGCFGLEVVNEDFTVLYPYYCFIVFLISVILLLNIILLYHQRISIEKMFLLNAILVGMVFILLITHYGSPDEPSHFQTAYRLSNEILGIKNDKPNIILMRENDFKYYQNDDNAIYVTKYSYYEFIHKFFNDSENEKLIECGVRNNLANASGFYYYPAAVGLTFARVIGLNSCITMLLARFFNLFFCSLLIFIAIKITPIGKEFIYVIGLLPMTLQQITSCSYDGIIIGISSIFIASGMKLLYEESHILVEMLYIITGVLLAMVKGGVYFPICLFTIILFFDKKIYRKKYFIIMSLFGFAFVKNNINIFISTLTNVQGEVTGGASGAELYTTGYLIKNPIEFLSIYFDTTVFHMDTYYKGFLGGNLGWLEIGIPWWLILLFVPIIIYSLKTFPDDYNSVLRNRIITLFIFLMCYFTVTFSMFMVWTPFGSSYIQGVQGRYFLPVSFMIPLILKNKKEKMDSYKLLETHILLLSIICITVFGVVLRK